MYTDLVNSFVNSSDFLLRDKSHSNHNKVGWNDYCKTAHSAARDSYLLWRDNGRPRNGPLFNSYRSSKSYFKCLLVTKY